MKTFFFLLISSLIVLTSCTKEGDNPIEDEFEATVQVTAASSTISESTANAVFTISLNKANTSGSALAIPFTISGTATGSSDYTEVNEVASIGVNETSLQVSIPIIDDSQEESSETIILTLGTLPDELSNGANTNATVTITDNDSQANTTITLTFDTSDGSTITVDSWTDVSADKYIIVINNTNSFTNITSSNAKASTTYVGYGEQVVYNGSSISSFVISMLAFSEEYYFKVIPVSSGTYDNAQTAASKSTVACVTTSTSVGQVCFEIGADTRTITSNQLSNHAVGDFPNADPTAIATIRILDLTPSYTGQATYVYDETGPPTPMNDNFYQFGIASNGVEFHPMGLKPWSNPDTGEQNWRWQSKVTEENETDLDAYGAHVTSQGNYHYHGDIVGLAANENGSSHSLLYGFAGDGFPIYYKYGFSDAQDATSSIVELESSYQIKSGTRTDTGTAGTDYPSGSYDGTYIQDYEYVQGLGDLDECNGRTGVTPEYPNGTYYYVITSSYPVVPICFYGTLDDDWKIGK